MLATAPNQLWSWDITKLRGPAKWTYHYLYVILDVFSRYVVGWMVALRESATLATKLIEETCKKQNVSLGQLTIHAERGSSMRSKQVVFLLADLSVTKTHSRPYTSNDNPYSESHFRTMKYRPEFPDRFGSFADSRLNASGSRQTSLSEVIRATEIVEIPGPSSGTDFSFRSGDCFTASGGSGYHNLRTTHSVSPPLA